MNTMKSNRRFCLFAMSVGACLCLGTTVQAQATRTWVSGVGDDANPGSRTAPAKTFAGVLAKTVVGGEIDVLDPGEFAPFTNTNSMTIDGKGPLAGVTYTNGPGALVSAAAGTVITLRNLSFLGKGGTHGVQVTGGGVVRLENCDISGAANNGVDFQPATANTRLYLINCHIHDCAGTGLLVNPASGGTVVVDNCVIEQCGNGINATAGTVILIGTAITGNSAAGLATSGSGAIKTFHNNLITGNTMDGNPTGSLPLR